MSGFVEDDEILGKAYDRRLIQRLYPFLRPYRGTAAAALGALVLAQGTFLALPYVLGRAVSLLEGKFSLDGWTLLPASWREACAGLAPVRQIAILAALYGTLVVVCMAATALQSYLTGLLGARVVRDIRRNLFAHIQRLPMAVFDRTPVGRWITRLTNDVVAISELFTTGIIVAFGDVLLLAGIVVVLFKSHAVLAALSLAVLPLLLLVTAVFRQKARASFRRVRMHLARVNAYLQESVSGSAVTLLFGRQAENARRFGAKVQDHFQASLDAIRVHATYVSAVTLLTGVSVSVALGYGGWLVAQGAMGVGELVAFLWYLGHFVQPVQDLSDKYNIFQAAMASAERIFRILDTPREAEPAAGGAAPEGPPTGGASRGASIAFENVTFAYDGEPVLRDVSFAVAAGERVAIVGSTGSGKTTLVNLLCRFYDLQQGVIRVDGVDIAGRPRSFARGRVALVLQDPVIFSGDLYANIRMGEDRISDEAVHAAAARVRADGFLWGLSRGFRTELPERGATLSAGERQLVTYARALAFDRPILVLDEATAHIDPETEALIQEGLDALMAGRTTLIIAHRLATLKRVDRILVFDRGRLAESGTHKELLGRGGIYARMHAYQYA